MNKNVSNQQNQGKMKERNRGRKDSKEKRRNKDKEIDHSWQHMVFQKSIKVNSRQQQKLIHETGQAQPLPLFPTSTAKHSDGFKKGVCVGGQVLTFIRCLMSPGISQALYTFNSHSSVNYE